MIVAVVGGGAAGTLAAIHLTVHPVAAPRHVVVMEPAAQLALGAAYGTRSGSHLLNVRAVGMSAFPDDPGHFLAWAISQGIPATADAFLPRLHYGRYLRDTLDRVLADHPASIVTHRQGHVTGVHRGAGRWWVAMADGTKLDVDHVILATGNRIADRPDRPAHPAVILDPWAPGAVETLRDHPEVLIVGTGLTAVDVALSLRDTGHRGIIRMTSTHGLLPEVHTKVAAQGEEPFLVPGTPAAAAVRSGLRSARVAAASVPDWRPLVDGLRPVTVDLWRGLPEREQRRFLRHVARHWEVRRHRMAPDVGHAVAALQASGALRVERGRVTGWHPLGGRLRATIRARGVDRTREVDAIVVCTGPSSDPRHDPLLASLLASRIAARHHLGVGIEVDVAGRVLSPVGAAQPGMWAMGALRRGAEWESTAVPELRRHAHGLAAAILDGPA